MHVFKKYPYWDNAFLMIVLVSSVNQKLTAGIFKVEYIHNFSTPQNIAFSVYFLHWVCLQKMCTGFNSEQFASFFFSFLKYLTNQVLGLLGN